MALSCMIDNLRSRQQNVKLIFARALSPFHFAEPNGIIKLDAEGYGSLELLDFVEHIYESTPGIHDFEA
jgi:hypothetical protein